MRTTLIHLLAASAVFASAPKADHPMAQAARAELAARMAQLGLDGNHDFAFKNAHDEADGSHIRLNQLYKGVRVFGGEAIVHLKNGEFTEITDALVRDLNLSEVPSIDAAEALAVAHGTLAPKGPYAHEPKVELVFAEVEMPQSRKALLRDRENGEVLEARTRMVLAYHVHAELENGADETKHMDYLVNAHTGEILESWSTLHTGAAVGTGKSQWYGSFPLNTNSVTGGYEMRDMTRGLGGGNATYDLNHGTSGTGTIYTDPDNTWGQLGAVYGSDTTNSTTGDIGQTAAVDAHNGLAKTWDFYGAVFGRNGIDNAGTKTYSRVHYSTGYDNAFWSDSCFCMTYGDGAPPSGSYGEADLDTCGHEMTHGVTSRSANLAYRGESGGLNEATSDIFGTCVEFWTLNGASGSTIPSTPGSGSITANYKMFENSWGHAYPNEALRWMYKPSRDGASPDFWSTSLKRLDVHYSSGVANHFFFLLAHGSQVDSLCDNIASPMTNGVTSITGIGNDKAARIWYRALTAYMTSSTSYVNTKNPTNTARAATLSAAKDLYGLNSTEYNTVALAWKAVNVQ
jgi:Zn-dependent metalloprotease